MRVMPVVLPGLIGTTDDATLAGMGRTPAATSLIASADGLEWQAVARFDGVALEALIEVGPGEFLVSGAEVARNSEGYPRVTGRGIWTIALTDPLDTIIQTSARRTNEDTWTTPDGRPQPVTDALSPDGSVCADLVVEATSGQILLITDWPALPGN